MAGVVVDIREVGLQFDAFRLELVPSVVRGLRRGLDGAAKIATRRPFWLPRSQTTPPGPTYIVSRSGKLKRTVKRTPVKRTGTKVTGGLQMRGPQARILELGGRTRPHFIAPKKAMALHWIDEFGNDRFSKGHWHPGSVFEPRAVLARAMVKATPKIVKEVNKEINKTLRKRRLA